ncbi:triple tyrosine motif-containing protein [Chryseosolibacter indicus]|nr:triple tyrosine motif-containing protein [Chryseosolibacter indicus]
MLLLLVLLLSNTFYNLNAQTDSLFIKGIPRVIHYTKKDFQGSTQFWTVCQDEEGVLYFGNNDGALVFDGQIWHKVSLPNNSSIRSLKVSSRGIVYAGGFNELGVIKKDSFGKYFYESLLNLIPIEDRNFENIWQIHEAQGHMVFRSFKMLIAIANNTAKTLPANRSYTFSISFDNKLFVQDEEGIKSLDLRSLSFTHLFNQDQFNGEELITLIPGVALDEVLAITKQGSFYRINLNNRSTTLWQKLLTEKSNDLVTCAIRSSSGSIYIGTLRSKVISLDANGYRISTGATFSGLQDNTVHNLFESSEGNIWAVLNNGIDCIDVKSPVSLLFEDASIYDVLPYKNKIYIATNQGVFVSTPVSGKTVLTKERFVNLNSLRGQAWSLQKFEDQLLCSHDKGIFVISDKGVSKLPGVQGIWKIIPIKGETNQYLACSYHGLFLLSYDSKAGFKVVHKIEGFDESCRDILQSEAPGVFWVCHGYKGVFKIKIDAALKRIVGVEHFKDQNGLPSPFNINVTRWNDEIVFTTNAGIYTYDAAKNKFLLHHFLTSLFGKELNVRRLFQYSDKTWFAHDNEVGYFKTNEEKPELQKDLFLQLKGSFNPSMECIVPLNQKNILVGTTTGLYAFDLSYNASARNAKTMITSASFKEDQSENTSMLDIATTHVTKLPHKSNNIIFHFSTPAFQNKLNVQYSYWLEGADNKWSDWSEASFREYNLLSAGSYIFHVKSRSLLGEKGTEAIYRFEILPAWYQSSWAIAFYIIIGGATIFFTILLVKRRIRREKEKTLREEREKRRVLELEIERMKLAGEKEKILKDKEQLEEDVIYKSKELVNYTTLLVKKRELLIEMQDQLKELKDAVKNESSRQSVRELLKKINGNLQNEEHIKVFEANFERVHHDFFTKLKANFPDLTQKELQLCAFVRMNLTNKEIASILNLSVRGIETARYRLRKRLGMSHEEDMSAFLEKLHSTPDGFGEFAELSV